MGSILGSVWGSLPWSLSIGLGRVTSSERYSTCFNNHEKKRFIHLHIQHFKTQITVLSTVKILLFILFFGSRIKPFKDPVRCDWKDCNHTFLLVKYQFQDQQARGRFCDDSIYRTWNRQTWTWRRISRGYILRIPSTPIFFYVYDYSTLYGSAPTIQI